jgi:hypothetical protein
MAKFYVYSKMSASVVYNDFVPGGADLPVVAKSVTIKGGAGIANKNLITPLGVVTEIDDADLEMLNRNGIFKLHKENGFITVEKRNVDVEKVVANMGEKADPSAPLSPADFEKAAETGGAAPMGMKKS